MYFEIVAHSWKYRSNWIRIVLALLKKGEGNMFVSAEWAVVFLFNDSMKIK